MTARMDFRGGETCSCVATSLPWVELDMKRRGLIVSHIDIYQLGYRDDVAASKGGYAVSTHAKGGNTDVGQYHPKQIECWRHWGWTMQKRLLSGVAPHAHGWPYGCPHLSASGNSQARDWDNDDAGLRGDAKVVGPYPVKHWEDALRENIMSLLSDLADEISTATAKKVLAGIGDAVWGADVIPNVWGDPKNPNVRAKNALGEIGRDANAIREKLQA
jgi:hypothetical protein